MENEEQKSEAIAETGKKKKRKILLLAGVVVVLLAACLFLFFYFQNPAIKLLAKVNDENYRRAVQ
jgi:flagellar basal body-associated protein FliL